ncbi:MAG: hypothetical protein ABSB70_06770 [Candidatus Velthaea sp.]
MKHAIALSLALALAPASALAQGAPPPGPPGMGDAAPSAAQMSAMRQVHAQAETLHVQARSRLIAALTPAHRAAVANVFGQLALSASPDPRAAAQALDAILSPAEKQSVVNIAAAERSNMHALMQQARATFESTLTAEQRAKMVQHRANMQGMHKHRALPPGAADPGAIVLRTLGSFGGPGMHGPGMRPRAF